MAAASGVGWSRKAISAARLTLCRSARRRASRASKAASRQAMDRRRMGAPTADAMGRLGAAHGRGDPQERRAHLLRLGPEQGRVGLGPGRAMDGWRRGRSPPSPWPGRFPRRCAAEIGAKSSTTGSAAHGRAHSAPIPCRGRRRGARRAWPWPAPGSCRPGCARKSPRSPLAPRHSRGRPSAPWPRRWCAGEHPAASGRRATAQPETRYGNRGYGEG